MRHLLVTNDFPPKVGGIQSYLWELWRRLPADDVTVLCLDHPEAPAWDATQPYRIERVGGRVLLPTPSHAARIDALADEVGAELVLLDPAFPLGAVGPRLTHPYGLVVHGAEVTVSAALPFVQLAQRRALRGARLVVAAGGFPAAEASRAAGRPVPAVVVPPGVDTERFGPLDAAARAEVRAELGLADDTVAVLGLSRLVPRKGFDVVVRAAAEVAADGLPLEVLIGGDGRDRGRLEALTQAVAAPVRFLGRVPDAELPRLYGAADAFAMLCRDRWGGLEQEGFGIVFLEAAAAGLPQLAGRSGGSAEAVVDGVTGFVVDPPTDVEAVADRLRDLVADPGRRAAMGRAARARAEAEFTYDHLARRLASALDALAPGVTDGQ